ncbi:Valine--tRNA ligase [Acorus calamus]|uniref:valine--tRNA ligase n=1 Tax=Acorus calamus TaxID=4465 RepID=A0AAV9DPV2_ACOCL|nr:Valine--tRNA ligase [Acorus calamus]
MPPEDEKPGSASQGGSKMEEEDPERKKKKEEKAREKELKKLKALQKAEAAKNQSQQKPSTKKSEKKNQRRGGGAEEEKPEDFIDPETPNGEKKKLSPVMAKQYSPSTVEKAWYAWWEKSNFFRADADSKKPPFVIVVPPPNVTGALHIGHGLTASIEDLIIRWRRMSGYNTLWVPGMDHAGIATQVVVEKKIMRERKQTRHDVGREAFVNEVDYKDIKERTLLKVPGYQDPVEFGVLTSFAYPLEGELGEIVVATTRVETMLGDTAIAIHPEDKRYSHLHGKFAIHPFNGRKLPIICDAILVDPEFGTGAVKITPAHDPNDFDVGKRHCLEFINIFTDDGNINSNGGSNFEGMPRFKARLAVVEALKEKGLYRGAQNNEMRLGICSRTNDVVEPMIKPQWFVNCQSMAKEALDAVMDENNRKIEIIPKQYAQEWKRWLENIRDWCISRQLWWGHRIPAWYVILEDDQLKEIGAYNDHWVVGRNEEEALSEAFGKFQEKKFHIEQDPDVLDTWFSSGLFPLSVLGWPDSTADFNAFYPTSVLETGHDILFFWVARMVMLGMKLGGDVPFRKVYLHPMIRDAHGRKMSKSLGNVIDPLEVINGVSLEGLHRRLEEGNLDRSELIIAKEGQLKDFPNGIVECGADALRFALISYTAQSDKINLDIQRVVGYRQWCNKLWNAIRFAMNKLGDDYCPPVNIEVQQMPFSCKWILSVLNKAISKTVSSLEAYEFSDAATAVYSWWQFQLCDVFIEVIKPYFSAESKFDDSRKASRDALWVCLDTGLRLLHPFMPFVTEELWQRLPQVAGSCNRRESIMISEYPSVVDAWTNEPVEREMGLIESIVKSIRSLRSMMPPNERNERRPAYVMCHVDVVSDTIRRYELEISTLASLSSLKVLSENDAAPAGCSVSVVNEQISVYLQLQGNLNAEAEREKLQKKREELQKQHDNLEKKMSASGYKEKVPQNIHEDNLKKLNKLLQELSIIDEADRKLIDTGNGEN